MHCLRFASHDAMILRHARLALAVTIFVLVSDGALVAAGTNDSSGVAAVQTEAEFVSAIRAVDTSIIRVSTNLRLSPAAWPASPILVNRNITVLGGSGFPLFDCAFLERKLTLAPGSTWTFKQVCHRWWASYASPAGCAGGVTLSGVRVRGSSVDRSTDLIVRIAGGATQRPPASRL